MKSKLHSLIKECIKEVISEIDSIDRICYDCSKEIKKDPNLDLDSTPSGGQCRRHFLDFILKTGNISKENAEELGMTKFKVVNQPNACEECRKLSGKIYTSAEVEKDGKTILPHHPNCYCILIPV